MPPSQAFTKQTVSNTVNMDDLTDVLLVTRVCIPGYYPSENLLKIRV